MNNFLFPPQIFLIFYIIDFLGDTCPNQLKNLVGHAFWVEVPFKAGCPDLETPAGLIFNSGTGNGIKIEFKPALRIKITHEREEEINK